MSGLALHVATWSYQISYKNRYEGMALSLELTGTF